MRVLFIGDIVGEAGRRFLLEQLAGLSDEYRADLIIANCENAAGGFGITPKIAEEMLEKGIHVLTSGNHIWDKKEIMDYLSREPRLLRPANYPDGVPGFGWVVIGSGVDKVGILNLSGRVFMNTLECPFRTAKKLISEIKKETKTIILDFHAEATSEKIAMGWHLDGEVAAVIGTHTHVQTADEEILPAGTAYITDVGMTGPSNSVIGIKKESAIEKFLTQMPKRFDMAKGPAVLSAVFLDIDTSTGRAKAIERISIKDKKGI
ncbi:MAG: TIGR00282 family metallophosphoesterase [Nitrospirae bacterium]|nr:TIGR00282 family metallophosphoesterase [Nitrospirota bacterium]